IHHVLRAPRAGCKCNRFGAGSNMYAREQPEELEETAKLIFILGDRPIRYLTAGEIAELRS
ncbi:hypothetical protein ACUOAQ_00645, partial [Escherichia sp. SP-MK]